MYPNGQQPNNPQNYGPQPQPTNQQPQMPGGYGPQPAPTYAVDYLDQIAPPPPRQKFLSGMFGKFVIILGVVFIFAVGIIVALGNQKNTASTEKMAVKTENLQRIANDTQKNIKSGKLQATNSNFNIWLKNTNRDAYDLLSRAGIKKTDMDKGMVAKEKTARDDLTKKFEDARLNANLDRVYAREMAYQAQLVKTDLDKLAKNGPGKPFRDFASNASKNLASIQKSFSQFDETAD